MLARACELVPSESGTIFLDDPLRKVDDRGANDLYAVASFGPYANRSPAHASGGGGGVAGEVYRSGEPYLSAELRPAWAAPARRSAWWRSPSPSGARCAG
jgi:hypothetical protein